MSDNTAGFYCNYCGHEVKVYTREEADNLEQKLNWNDNGNPECPQCESEVTFEDYIADNQDSLAPKYMSRNGNIIGHMKKAEMSGNT